MLQKIKEKIAALKLDIEEALDGEYKKGVDFDEALITHLENSKAHLTALDAALEEKIKAQETASAAAADTKPAETAGSTPEPQTEAAVEKPAGEAQP
jgi:hypothetical protein